MRRNSIIDIRFVMGLTAADFLAGEAESLRLVESSEPTPFTCKLSSLFSSS